MLCVGHVFIYVVSASARGPSGVAADGQTKFNWPLIDLELNGCRYEEGIELYEMWEAWATQVRVVRRSIPAGWNVLRLRLPACMYDAPSVGRACR